VFLACSFWYADNLALLGRVRDARALYERLLGLANDVGLLSEEYDPHAGRLLGNFPQAFSHVSLINSACGLTRATEGRVSDTEGERPLAASDTVLERVQKMIRSGARRAPAESHWPPSARRDPLRP
jgi:hypothetical protein